MSHKATYWAMKAKCPSPNAKLALLVLADAHNGHTGDCFPSYKFMMTATGLSEQSLRRCIKELVEASLIAREMQHDHAGRDVGFRYFLLMPCGEGEGIAHDTPRYPRDNPGGYQNPHPSKENREKETIEAPPPKKASRLPDDWRPRADLVAYALGHLKNGARVKVEIEKFRSHWQGNGKAMVNWDACWRKWVLNAVQYQPPSRGGAFAGTVMV